MKVDRQAGSMDWILADPEGKVMWESEAGVGEKVGETKTFANQSQEDGRLSSPLTKPRGHTILIGSGNNGKRICQTVGEFWPVPGSTP